PIVFVVAEDPVRLGLVASLARPGGNATGINFLAAELAAKRLELLRTTVPTATRVAALLNPAEAMIAEANRRDVGAAASGMGLQSRLLTACTSTEIDHQLAPSRWLRLTQSRHSVPHELCDAANTAGLELLISFASRPPDERMTLIIDRRQFAAALGSAAAWPIAARGQQSERMRRIGILLPGVADDAEYQARVGAFLQALGLFGWTIGRNMRIDTRWSGANAADIRKLATELVALAPDVILAHGASAVAAVLQATRTVPIVFPVVPDPVAAGF